MCLVVDHKHCLHVAETQTVIAAFGTTGDLIPDSIHELLNEEIVGDLGHVLLLLEDFLTATLHKVGLQGYRYLNVDICLDVLLWNQLNLGVVLRNPSHSMSNQS